VPGLCGAGRWPPALLTACRRGQSFGAASSCRGDAIKGASTSRRGVITSGAPPAWTSPSRCCALTLSLALSLTLTLTLTLIVNLTLKPKTKPGPSLPLPLTLTQVLRASSEVFAGALRDSTGRADEAVAKRERTSAYLEQCEASLRARDDELAQSQRELRELRAVLRESHAKLTRVRPGASVLHPRTGYAYRPASCALYAPEAQGSLPPGRRSTARTRPRTLGVPHPGTAWCTTGRRTSCCGSRRS
jgi:hypothetical protein